MSAIVRIDNVLSTLGSFDFNLGKKSSSGITLLLSLWLLNNQMDFETQNGIEEVAAIIRGNPDYGRDESPANGRYHSRSRLEAQGSPEFVKDESPANGRYHSRSRSEGRGTSYYPKDESPANGRYHRVFVDTVSELCVKHVECPVITIKRRAKQTPQDPVVCKRLSAYDVAELWLISSVNIL
ncbi:uncharacterized protein [Spinacia oleracea]|uniref:Uncharacterized protein isoform X1 n=1 Tax=Spinacia oleracea TaxID=3562 RepID=A0ABM3QH55_SPIOL|nr:uncharacterized protein LOC130459380 isoform X1 [Spinacia oleracea]